MVGACEYGNELSGSIKCGEFLDKLQNQLASQEGLCSMEYVSKYDASGSFAGAPSTESCVLDGLREVYHSENTLQS